MWFTTPHRILLEYYVNSVPVYRYGNYRPALAYVNLRSAQPPPHLSNFTDASFKAVKGTDLSVDQNIQTRACSSAF